MRANQSALVTLNADLRIPDRYLGGEVTLLPLGRPKWPGAIHGEGADREKVSFARQHDCRNLLHEIGRLLGHNERPCACGARRLRHFDLVKID